MPLDFYHLAKCEYGMTMSDTNYQKLSQYHLTEEKVGCSTLLFLDVVSLYRFCKPFSECRELFLGLCSYTFSVFLMQKYRP